MLTFLFRYPLKILRFEYILALFQTQTSRAVTRRALAADLLLVKLQGVLPATFLKQTQFLPRVFPRDFFLKCPEKIISRIPENSLLCCLWFGLAKWLHKIQERLAPLHWLNPVHNLLRSSKYNNCLECDNSKTTMMFLHSSTSSRKLRIWVKWNSYSQKAKKG